MFLLHFRHLLLLVHSMLKSQPLVSACTVFVFMPFFKNTRINNKINLRKIFLTGDLMGPTVNNLDKLLRMPNGCGEQTMLGFAPDVFVSNYLSATHQLSSDIEEKAIGFMEKGMLYRLSTRDFTFTKNSEEMKHRNLLLKPRQISCLPVQRVAFI